MMKIGFSGLVHQGGSVCDTSSAGWRLLGGRETSVRTSIPSVRLTRAGKGTTFCRTHKLGRTYSSVCNKPAAQQSPPLRRCYTNSRGTWLRIGCASGHRGSLLASFQERESSQAGAHLRHHHTRSSWLTGMVALGRLHSCGHGKHRGVLEADLRHFGRSVRDSRRQCSAREEGPWSQDRRERRGMDRGFALPRVAARQFRSAQAHPRTPRLGTLPPQAGGKPVGRTQPPAESARYRQHQAGQRSQRCVRGFWSPHGESTCRRQRHGARAGSSGQKATAQEDSRTATGAGRKSGRTPPFLVKRATASTLGGGKRSSLCRATYPRETKALRKRSHAVG